MRFTPWAMPGAVRRWLVAVALACACATSPSTTPHGGDAGDDSADAPRDLQLAEIDCPECDGSCGDGKLGGGEHCDDGNRAGGDGCTPLCQVEAGWTCPTPGQPCLRL